MRVLAAQASPPRSMAPKAKRKKKNKGRKREVYWTNGIARMRAQAAEQGQEANSPDSDYLDDETSIRLLWEVAQQEAHDELALPIDCASCKDWQKDFKDGKQALKDEMGDECEAEVKGEADPWGEYKPTVPNSSSCATGTEPTLPNSSSCSTGTEQTVPTSSSLPHLGDEQAASVRHLLALGEVLIEDVIKLLRRGDDVIAGARWRLLLHYRRDQ